MGRRATASVVALSGSAVKTSMDLSLLTLFHSTLAHSIHLPASRLCAAVPPSLAPFRYTSAPTHVCSTRRFVGAGCGESCSASGEKESARRTPPGVSALIC